MPFNKELKQFYRNIFALKHYSNFSINLLIFNILLISIFRWIADFLWIPELHTTYNIYVWFIILLAYVISLPISIDFLVRKIARLKYNKKRLLKFFVFNSKLWWLMIFVPVISSLFDKEITYAVTIKIFKYIPTFMENYNYLPIGMIVLIPIFIILTSNFVKENYNISTGKSILSSSLGLIILYIYFYQWLWGIFIIIFLKLITVYKIGFSDSYVITVSLYDLGCLLYALFFVKSTHKILKKYPLYIYYLFVMVNITILVTVILFKTIKYGIIK